MSGKAGTWSRFAHIVTEYQGPSTGSTSRQDLHTLDHAAIAVADMARALTFCTRALAALGITQLMARGDEVDSIPDQVGDGSDFKPFFWIGKGEPVQGDLHIAFADGGHDKGKPGLRPEQHAG